MTTRPQDRFKAWWVIVFSCVNERTGSLFRRAKCFPSSYRSRGRLTCLGFCFDRSGEDRQTRNDHGRQNKKDFCSFQIGLCCVHVRVPPFSLTSTTTTAATA